MTGEGLALPLDAAVTELEEIEIRLLLEGVRLCYGYDFREYAHAPMRRSLMGAMAREDARTISAYQDRILHDPSCMQRFLGSVGVNVTSMFRDPEQMRAIRDEVIPLLKTYPSVRVWVVGCATGEEAFSLAIALHEEGVLKRTSIYATDLNEELLARARCGEIPIDRMERYADAYARSGGRAALTDYYTVAGRTARVSPQLTSGITWARHNLVSDGSFNDFHLVVCANLLIYFRASLQERAHRLLYDSLIRGGFLALGKRESLVYCPDRDNYEQVLDGMNLYRKTRW